MSHQVAGDQGSIRNLEITDSLNDERDDDIVVPIMVIEPGTEEPIHLVGRTKGNKYVTACGKEADKWNIILSFEPTCTECILVQRA